MTPWYPTPQHPVQGVFVREHALAVRPYVDVVVLHHITVNQPLAERYVIEWDQDRARSLDIPILRVRQRRSRFSSVWTLKSAGQAVEKLQSDGFRPDLVHAHIFTMGWVAVRLRRRFGFPVVVTEQTSAIPRGLLSRRSKMKARYAFRHADLVLPVSRALQSRLEAYAPRARYVVVPNTVDPTLFHPGAGRPRDPGSPKELLYVGLLVPVKGLPILMRALHRLVDRRRDWRLTLVGDGPDRTRLESMSRELGLESRVKFLGYRSKDEIAEFMRRSDLLVLPSRWDNMPCVLLEALACGLPVIASKVGGIPEIVTDGLGWLVPPGRVESWVDGLDAALDGCRSVDRMRIAEIARRRWSHQTVGTLLDSLYRRVLRGDFKGR